jgi:glycine reductase
LEHPLNKEEMIVMNLTMASYHVIRVEEAGKAGLEKGVLYLNTKDLQGLVLSDDRITDMHLEIAYPGEETRIVHILDAMEPRIKPEQQARCFPGFLGLPTTVGAGRTNRLAGTAVIATAATVLLPSGQGTGVQEFNEGVIDMSGPGQSRCACSDTINICLCMTFRENLSTLDFDEAARMALIKVSDRIAEVTLDRQPDEETVYKTGVIDPDLPNVAYINQVQSQGHICRTFLYAMPMEGFFTPTILDPTELFDGAVVSGNYRNHLRTCTWLQQNNPYVLELFRRHGKECNFVGQVVSRGHYDDLGTKIRSGNFVAKLAAHLKAHAAVLSLEGTGNSNVDYMATVKALENSGIVAVPVVHEFGGPGGDEEPLFDFAEEAVSVVSGGGIDRRIELPPMKRVIGGDSIRFTNSTSYNKSFDPHQPYTAIAHFFFCGFRSLQNHGWRCEEY